MNIYRRVNSLSGVRLAAACAFAAVAAVSASATTITFAQYDQITSTNEWTISTSGTTTTVQATGLVDFRFLIPGTQFGTAFEQATFSLTATSTSPGNCAVSCGPGDTLTQAGYSGTFSIIDDGSDMGANLLSGTFAVTGSPTTTGAQFGSSVGGSGGSFNASATAGNLNQLILTSSFVNFNNQTQEVSSFSLSSLAPNFATGTVTNNQAYPGAGPFVASGSGTFSSNPGPTVTPEPATLCTIGTGLVCIGLVRRRKRLGRI